MGGVLLLFQATANAGQSGGWEARGIEPESLGPWEPKPDELMAYHLRHCRVTIFGHFPFPAVHNCC